MANNWMEKVFQPTPEPPRLNDSDFRKGQEAGERPPIDRETDFTHMLFTDYRDQLKRWLYQAREDVEFYEGKQWGDADMSKMKKDGQHPIVIPLVFRAVEQALSMLAARDPEFRVTARDDSDVKRAHLRSHLLQWIWDQSKSEGFHFKNALKDYYVRGRGFLYVYIDPDKDLGKGEVMMKTIDPDYVIVPPNTKSAMYDDADHIIMVSFMTIAQIHDMWPHVDLSMLMDAKNNNVDTSLWHSDTFRQNRFNRGEDYYSLGGRYGEIESSPITNPLDFISTESEPYIVFERFTKVKRLFWRIEDPKDPFAEELLDNEAYQHRLQMSAFILFNEQNGTQVIKNVQEVAQAQQFFQELGGIIDPEIDTQVHYHFVPGLPDPMTMQQGQPMLKPGLPGPDAIPGSHHVLIHSTIQRIIEQHQLLQSISFRHARIRHCGSVGTQMLWEPYDLPTEHYTIVPILNSHNRHPYPQGDITRIKDIQRLYNKHHSMIMTNLINASNIKVFVPTGSTMNLEELQAKWTKTGAQIIEYEPDPMGTSATGGIQIVHPGQINTGLFQYLLTLKDELNETLGLYPLQQGDSNSAPDTYRATIAIDEFGNRRVVSRREDIYASLNRCAKVALDLASVVYDPSKVIRTVNPSGDQTVFQITDLTPEAQSFSDPLVNQYDVITVSGSTLPSNRWAQREEAFQWFQGGALDHEALLKLSDFPDAEQVLERMGAVQQMERQMMEMQQYAQDLVQKLEMMQKQLEDAEMGEEAKEFANELKIALAKEIEQIKSDADLRDLKIDHEVAIKQLMTKHQRELMQMERRISMSKRKATN